MKKLNRLRDGLLVVSLLAGLHPSTLFAATVGVFTGGDPGEGLDLQGNFTYAVNVGPSGPAGKVGDANFTADNTPGVTVIAENNIATGGWLTADFGTTSNDQGLEAVLASIRWAAAPNVVTVRLRVEVGVDYKLQLLFGEQCCPNRGFNIVLAGNPEILNFLPGPVQAGDGEFAEQKTKVGAVITHQFKASSAEYEIVLDGPSADAPEIGDRNAILNGFTLERLSAVNDTDGDGLPDDWEQKFFSGLGEGGTNDGDQDALSNAQEFAIGSSPTDADSDDDGLADGDEVARTKTDPIKRDSDGDTLGDGDEVNAFHTDPAKPDTDGDGTVDPQELTAGTDPTNPAIKPVLTQLSAFTGPDPGEGLDLDGNFIYALAVGAGDDAAVKIRDAQFSPIIEAEVSGANLVAGNTAQNWYVVNYGDSPDELALRAVTGSIRWSSATTDIPEVVLTLDNLEAGAAYKVQLMFGEQCCNRGFDVLFDDKPVADNFNPGQVQGGIAQGKQEALITRYHFATNTQLIIRLDGRTAPYPDHNAILNAVTVERLSGQSDTDSDGLHDEWEKLYFNGLTNSGAQDSDGDGLNNATEFGLGTDPSVADSEPDGLNDAEERTAGTSPNNADSDGDGLRDGVEVKTTLTNPLLADTDGDSLSDGVEVNQHKSDPKKKDSDDDGFSDLIEVFSKTDPANAASKPVKLLVQPVTGGDPQDGADFSGNFTYALNIGGLDAPKVGDAQFVTALIADEIPGVTVDLLSEISAWTQPALGDSADDDSLEVVLQSIRHNGAGNTVTLANLTPGHAYKLQLLFFEQCCARGFDVLVNGQLVVDEFAPYVVQGGINNTTAGALIAYTFTATSPDFVLSLNGETVTTAAYTDHNEILNGLTLEDLGVAPTEIRITGSQRSAAGFAVTFGSDSGKSYRLEYKETLGAGAWESVGTATASGASTTITDNGATRLGKPSGFYRVSSQ
ncbi:MAG: hypothetical protein JNK85_20840 [Verrucomicrobiales bacterium]|nr:hypothetical protein [Verrucomicrobiales bacterium]